MTSRQVCVFLVAGALALEAGCGGSATPIQPGGKIDSMSLTRGTSREADLKLFDVCNPIILKPGPHVRSCRIPRLRRLFIGYGEFEPTRQTLARDWQQTRWNLWVDGHPVNLPAFRTSDRTLFGFPPAGGKDVILREWDVILVNATPGKHTLRYRSRKASGGPGDATWTFTVAGN